MFSHSVFPRLLTERGLTWIRYIQEILPCDGGEADQQPLNQWVVEAAKLELTL